MGSIHVLEQINFSSSRDIGISESTFSGPIAIIAVPIHASSWVSKQRDEWKEATERNMYNKNSKSQIHAYIEQATIL